MLEDRYIRFAGVLFLAALLGLGGCKGSSGRSSTGSSSVAGSSVTPAPAPGPAPAPPPPETPPTTPAPVPPAPVKGSAELFWTAPTQNEDGSALTSLAGYKVRYGQSPGSLDQEIDISGGGTTSLVIEDLPAGTWYFTVASYTNTGVVSAPAGPVYKTIG